VEGPDLDIPGSPLLRTLKDGKRLLIVGTKPGDIFALDPDRKGALVWRVGVNGPLYEDGPLDFKKPRVGPLFGWAADDTAAYFGLQVGGMAAVRLEDGRRLWLSPLNWVEGGRISYPAASSAIPGAAFVGGSDGVLFALSTADGRVLWKQDTVKSYDTVNKVAANGGSMGSAGPTIADGMLFVGSGYAVGFTKPGNALLAFAPE